MELTQVILITLILLFSSLLQGVSGFGFGIMAMAFLPFVMDIKQAVVLVAYSSLISVILLGCKFRHSLKVNDIKKALIGIFLGIPMGVILLKRLDKDIIEELLGIAIIMAGLQLYYGKERSLKKMAGNFGQYFAGFISGTLGGAFSMGGPPLVIYSHAQNWGKEKLMANLQFLFVFSLGWRLVIYSLNDLVTIKITLLAILLSPIILIGSNLGAKHLLKIPSNGLKKITGMILIILGLMIIFK